MVKKSKAAVLVGKEEIEIKEFPVPEIGPDEGMLRVEACGVCGFDNEAYLNGGNGVYQLPCVLGHEIVGRVDQIGDKASEKWGLKEGDRIAVEEYIPCGACDHCLIGKYHLCFKERYGAMSINNPKTALWGGFSEYMYLHPRSIIHKVSDNVSAELLQLFIPISNGLHWVQEVGGAKSGDTVVIQGPGPMGLGSIIGAKEAGAETIIVTGLKKDEQRLKMAKEFGATHTIYADEQNIVHEIEEITNGEMGNVVINAATHRQQIVDSLDLAAKQGTIVHSGTEDIASEDFKGNKVTWKLLTIKGVLGRPKRTVGAALKVIESGRYPFDKMVTHAFPVEEAHRAVRTASYGEDGAIHVAVVN